MAVESAEVVPGLNVIDLEFQGQPHVIACYLLEGDGELALVETGPASTLPRLLAALPAGGDDVDRLTTIAVTHIHLDHSGAAGHLLRRAPNATLYVHGLGAPHLIDPSRLLRSASRIYGSQMNPLWGEVVPVPEDRIVIVDEGDTVPAAGRMLDVLYTPGHASHHVAYHDAGRSLVFTGDVAGARLPGSRYVRPPTPPPDIDVEVWSQSIRRLSALEPTWLLLTHFGPFRDDARQHLSDLDRRLHAWTELVRSGLEMGQDAAAMVDSLRREADAEFLAEGNDTPLLQPYEMAAPYGMSVDGLRRYVQKSTAT